MVADLTYLIERLEKHPIDERELDRMTEVSKSDFDVSPEISDNSLPMLYQTGYMTIKGYSPEDDSYTLGYPNKEVKMGFIKDLLGRYRSADRIYVFEFKVDGSAEDALKQIDDKGHLIPYKAEEGMEQLKVGVNISTRTRTIDAWKEVVG